jgi:hypothetical protein
MAHAAAAQFKIRPPRQLFCHGGGQALKEG